jgi:hypothetical protein
MNRIPKGWPISRESKYRFWSRLCVTHSPGIDRTFEDAARFAGPGFPHYGSGGGATPYAAPTWARR